VLDELHRPFVAQVIEEAADVGIKMLDDDSSEKDIRARVFVT
jgi:hypothetical protein